MEVLREQLEGDLMRRELVAASARQWLGKPWSQVGDADWGNSNPANLTMVIFSEKQNLQKWMI